jgi:hypothetical protein
MPDQPIWADEIPQGGDLQANDICDCYMVIKLQNDAPSVKQKYNRVLSLSIFNVAAVSSIPTCPTQTMTEPIVVGRMPSCQRPRLLLVGLATFSLVPHPDSLRQMITWPVF